MTQQYIKYLDFPKIPEDLLESVEDILNKPRFISIVKADYFQTRPINQNLQDWLTNHLAFEFDARYQLIYTGLPIHKDLARTIAYNYLLVSGGHDVKTIIYDNDKNILETYIIPLKTWHSINTDMYHGVDGILLNNVRVALSITPKTI